MPETRPTPTAAQILATPMGPNGAGAKTVRAYLVALLAELWDAGEEFNGKHPFGNSGWEWDLHSALAKAGHVRATLGADGYVDDLDEPAANHLINVAIKSFGQDGAPDA